MEPCVDAGTLAVMLCWTCGALAILGVVGAMLTSRPRWLGLIVVAALMVVLDFLYGLAKFHWGM